MMMKKETGMSMIELVDATDGHLVLYAGNDKIYANTVDTVVDAMMNYGMSESVMSSSAVHYAAEHGFENDDSAVVLLRTAWNTAIGLGL